MYLGLWNIMFSWNFYYSLTNIQQYFHSLCDLALGFRKMRGAEENITAGDSLLNDLENEAEMVFVVPEVEMNSLENINTLYQSSPDIISENMENIPIYNGNQPIEVDEYGDSDFEFEFESDHDYEEEDEMIFAVPQLEMNYLENVHTVHQFSLDMTSEDSQNIPIHRTAEDSQNIPIHSVNQPVVNMCSHNGNQPVVVEEEDNSNFEFDFGSIHDAECQTEMFVVVPELEMNFLENVVTGYQSSSDMTSENSQNIPIHSVNQPVEVVQEDNFDFDFDFESDTDDDYDEEDVIGENGNSWR